MSVNKASDLIGRPPAGRKLIAVVYADMVGYSRLIGLDDEGTLERLRTLRSTLIDPAIDQHGGRIVQTGGDSLLIVFDSIDGAMRCAVKVQQQMAAYDGDHPSDRTIRFRVGINIGDAIPDGTDLHGEVVNVAERLQAQCPPGGICVTRPVRDHVQDRLGLVFEELGSLSLKNIARPVEAFVLRFGDAVTTPISVAQSSAHSSSETLPLHDKPSIAVLPFANLSSDPEQEYFADGLTEDILTALARFAQLTVIARNSTFVYKGRAVSIADVGRDLRVRYVLEGSVRRSGDRVRVTAQLIEAATSAHLWAERYDRAITDIFAVQDEITEQIVTRLVSNIERSIIEQARRKPPEFVRRIRGVPARARATQRVAAGCDGGRRTAVRAVGRARSWLRTGSCGNRLYPIPLCDLAAGAGAAGRTIGQGLCQRPSCAGARSVAAAGQSRARHAASSRP